MQTNGYLFIVPILAYACPCVYPKNQKLPKFLFLSLHQAPPQKNGMEHHYFNDETRSTTPLDIIAYHAASAQIGLALWWLDHHKPYSVNYMAQASIWLSLGGLLRALDITEFHLPMPQPE